MSDDRQPARRRLRSDGPRSAGPPALLGFMVVALTAGMLALAGTTPRGIGAPVDAVARVALDQRTFVCDAALPGSSVRQGSAGVVGGELDGRPPYVLEVGREQAADAYAGELASAQRWAAWQPCPEPQARWWFTGAGGAAVTHDTVLSVTNPRTGAAVLDVDVFGPSGPVEAPALHGITLEGGATRAFDLAKVAPAVGELAVRVVATRGLVTVSAADAFSPSAIGKEVREWLPPTSLPATSVTLTGLATKPEHATLVVANQSNREAIAQVQVIGAGGTFAPEGVQPLTIAPKSVATLPLRSVFDGNAVSLRVTSQVRVVAGMRATVGTDIAYATGVRPIRGSTTVAVPAGTDRKVVLSSVGRPGRVTVTGYDARGKQVLAKEVDVAAATTVVLTLPKSLVTARLAAPRATVAGGLVVTSDRGVMTAGIASSLRSIRLPVVRPGW